MVCAASGSPCRSAQLRLSCSGDGDEKQTAALGCAAAAAAATQRGSRRTDEADKTSGTLQAPQAAGAPFTDGKGLIDYVMSAYKALGATKGAAIQNVLTQLGYQNINDVKPEHYAALHAGVEALKG